jgi:magnesium and cobalt exporter, CNNM family
MTGESLAVSGAKLALASRPEAAPLEEWPLLGVVVGLVLVLLNGFFVLAEFALVKVRPTQIEPYIAKGDRRAKLARHMIRHLDAYLSSTQLGVTLSSLALGWIGEPAFAWVFEPLLRHFIEPTEAVLRSLSIAVAFMTITVLHIVIGELAPKSIAIRRAERAALLTAVPLFVFYKLTFPVIWLLNKAANGLLRLLGIAPASESEGSHTEEELRLLLASAAGNPLPLRKREMLDRVFELSSKVARQVMVPRSEVVYLSTTAPLEASLERARSSGYTRYPITLGGLDDVAGFVHIKDLFRAATPPSSLLDVARKLEFIPETMPLDRLLQKMQRQRIHFAAVVDEYGGVSGIISLEDVLESVVGELRDEFDGQERPDIVKVARGVYRVSGAMLVHDAERALGAELGPRHEDTLGGAVLSELGRRPKVGDRVRIGSAAVEVLEVDLGRIQSVRVSVEPAQSRAELASK